MNNPKDNFSVQSNLYVKYRPNYPEELYTYLFSKTTNFEAAWDCGTGNGQVARHLAGRFQNVFATDISEKQLNNAYRAENVKYSLAPAEKTPLLENSIDLITVAQAIHWFDHELFYKEAQRTGKINAVLAYWGYNLPRINKFVDDLIRDFHDRVVGPYWDPERNILLNEYVDIHFPLSGVKKKKFFYTVQWSADQLIGYLNSWSSVQKYIRENNENPVEAIEKELKNKILDNQVVTFPVFMTLGYLS